MAKIKILHPQKHPISYGYTLSRLSRLCVLFSVNKQTLSRSK